MNSKKQLQITWITKKLWTTKPTFDIFEFVSFQKWFLASEKFIWHFLTENKNLYLLICKISYSTTMNFLPFIVIKIYIESASFLSFSYAQYISWLESFKKFVIRQLREMVSLIFIP